MIHDYKLRPYHNPKGADESLVPDGWRMLYADEFPLASGRGRKCRLFVSPICGHEGTSHFGERETCTGAISNITYIVPVTP